MIPSISCTAPAITPDAGFDAPLSPYDCRPSVDSSSDHRIPLYPPYDTPPHLQAGAKRLSATILTNPIHHRARFPSDGAGRNSHSNSTSPMDWAFHHSDHTYQAVQAMESVSLKQPEYGHDPADAQGIQVHQVGSFTDVASSINNTRVFHNLEGHHQMSLPYLAPTQYPTQLPPLPHTEGVRAAAPSPSWGYDMESYYGSQAASTQYPMDDQISFESQPSVSNNLHHHVHGYSNDHHQQPSQLNQAHVSNNGGSFELTPSTTVAGVGTGQPQVDMTAAAAAAPPPPPSSSSSSSSPSSTSSFPHHLYTLPGSVPRVFDHEGCTDIPQLAVHSERPPLSSYSEFSAQMKYFSHMASAHQIGPAQVYAQQQQQQQQQLQLQLQPPSLISAMSGPGRVWTGSNSSVSPLSSSGDNTPITSPTGILLSSSPSSPVTVTAAQDLSSSSSSPLEPWTSSLPQRKPVKTESVDATLTLPSIAIPLSKRLAPSSSSSSSDAAPGSKPTTTSSLRRRCTPPSPSFDTSRRSRTLSPSSRTIGGLKTIIMRKGTSEPKKQNLACLFCRERKIACGRPTEGSVDLTCNQCARRSLVCQYPTESRRGQHKRSKKNQPDHHHGHNVNGAK